VSLAPTTFFDQTVSIYRQGATVKDDGGYPNQGRFTLHLANILAAARPTSGNEAFVSGMVGTEQPVTFYVEAGQDIVATDLVLWNGDYYEVLGPRVDAAYQNRFLRIDAVRRDRNNYTDLLA